MSNEAATLPATIWHRSSYSGGQGDCLELAQDIPALAPVRDSKNRTGHPLRAKHMAHLRRPPALRPTP